MKGLFITFEGTEGGGKSTQIRLLADQLIARHYHVRSVREPGGTPIGEEVRHTLKHSESNHAMTPEAELLLMNASRAQLVREVIRPALAQGEIVLCDRFFDSTTAYQGYGRGLSLEAVRSMIAFAVGETVPDLTLLLHLPLAMSEARRLTRQTKLLEVPAEPGAKVSHARLQFNEPLRDRMEEADRAFFERVQLGFLTIAKLEPQRVRLIDATASIAEVNREVWSAVERLLSHRRPQKSR